MAVKCRRGICENCKRYSGLRTNFLCHSCWHNRKRPGYMPGMRKKKKIEPTPTVPIATRLFDEWWHFKALCGREQAIHLLSRAWNCHPHTIRDWAHIHDPEPREVAA